MKHFVHLKEIINQNCPLFVCLFVWLFNTIMEFLLHVVCSTAYMDDALHKWNACCFQRQNNNNYTAASTKVVPQKCKSIHDSANGVMGSKSLALLDWGSRCWERREEKLLTWVCAISIYMLKHLDPQLFNHKTTITHNNFRHCGARFSSFVRQPLSKQLYM